MNKESFYNEEISFKKKKFKNFDIRKYRENNIDFKRHHYKGVSEIFDMTLSDYFEDIKELDLSDEEIAYGINDLVFISSIIITLDFLIPCHISSNTAYIFYKYGLYLNNIFYAKNKKEKYQNYIQLSSVLDTIKESDFENKHFIIKL